MARRGVSPRDHRPGATLLPAPSNAGPPSAQDGRVRSPRLLMLLLVLFVLVPAGILGWLGIRGTDRFVTEMRQRIEQELDLVGQSAKRMTTELEAEEALDADARVAAAADLLARRLPFERVGRALAEANQVLFVGAPTGPPSGAEFDLLWQFSRPELRIIDATGRLVLPVLFEPDGPTKGRSDSDRLFDDLSREADAARFGRDDLEGALAIWKDAGARFSEPAWKARAEIEALRLRGRFSFGPDFGSPLADDSFVNFPETDDLHARYPEDVLVAVGRPWVLHLLRTYGADALRRLDDHGRLAEIPLTELERGRIREQLGPRDPPGSVEVAGGRDVHRTSLPGGLVLEVTRRWPSLRVGPARALIERWRARLPAVVEVGVSDAPDRPPAADRSGRVLVAL